MRAIARRWLILHDEIKAHEQELERMVQQQTPELMQSHGISTMTVAEMLILVGDNPQRVKSEAALDKLCGVCPIPASSGKTNRIRLNRGGNRQANAALYRVAIVRVHDHGPAKAYAARRMTKGETKREIVRCIKRYIVREIYRPLHAGCPSRHMRRAASRNVTGPSPNISYQAVLGGSRVSERLRQVWNGCGRCCGRPIRPHAIRSGPLWSQAHVQEIPAPAWR